jgi:hypothetical protein
VLAIDERHLDTVTVELRHSTRSALRAELAVDLALDAGHHLGSRGNGTEAGSMSASPPSLSAIEVGYHRPMATIEVGIRSDMISESSIGDQLASPAVV